jgi:hypothetical protein
MELKSKQGKLTPYAFACGYMEQKNRLSLYMINPYPKVYRVAGFNKADEFVAEEFLTLTEARKFFKKIDME